MDKIAILDYGSQYTHLLATRIRKLGVYSEILDPDISAEDLKDYKGIILSGGPNSVYEEAAPKADPGIFELGLPILGVCYGHQLMTKMLGGKVEPGTDAGAEYGKTEIEIIQNKGIFGFTVPGSKIQVWMSHGDKVTALPDGFEILASSKDDDYSAVGNISKNFYGVQFHAEVTHTMLGNQMLSNFVKITDAKTDWDLGDFIDKEVKAIQEKVGDKKVFLLVSGGVDSSVAFVLLERALSADRVYGLFVDTGFMRAYERNQVASMLKEAGVTNLHIYDASKEFFTELKGVIDPEKKREIIGRIFLEVQKKVSKELGLNPDEWILGQGTIYPDTIESGGTKHAAKIKTHHNRVPEIEELIKQGKVIEPLKDLYKDEVREVGERLKLPEHMIWRHPFPGPGLAVRILCVDKEDWAENHLELDKQINVFLKEQGSKLNANTLPIKSVGVQGDLRTYRHPVALSGEATWEQLAELSPALTNKFSEINRVLYLISPDQINSMSAKTSDLNLNRIKLLQQADKLAMDWLRKIGEDRHVWQMPTVLIPVSINVENQESIVLRPIISDEAMTANFAKLPMEKVQEIAASLMKYVSAVFYDVTNKPPGTIEWE